MIFTLEGEGDAGDEGPDEQGSCKYRDSNNLIIIVIFTNRSSDSNFFVVNARYMTYIFSFLNSSYKPQVTYIIKIEPKNFR